MRVLVLLKQVPDIVSERGMVDGRLIRSNRDAVLNEVDEGALETALRAAEVLGGSVTAITMGPAQAVGVVRKALQVGAGGAVHLLDDAFAGSDARATALALARCVRLLEAEDGAEPIGLVVAGMTALDGLGSVVPALVAAELGWPVLSFAESAAVDGAGDATVTVTRAGHDGRETLCAALPAVVSVTDTIAHLRAPSFATMLAARTAAVWEVTAADLGLSADQVGAAGSRAVVVASEPRPPRPAPEVVTHDGAATLVDFLTSRGFGVDA